MIVRVTDPAGLQRCYTGWHDFPERSNSDHGRVCLHPSQAVPSLIAESNDLLSSKMRKRFWLVRIAFVVAFLAMDTSSDY